MNTQPDGAIRTLAIATLVAAAIGSLVLMARMGQRQASSLVIALFVIWDAAPFALLGLAVWASRAWDARVRMAVYSISFAVSIASVGAYVIDTIGPPHPQAAFMYVIVPPIAVIAAGIVLLTAHRLYNVK